GVAYITPDGAVGTIDTVDLRTGVVKTGPQLKGAPYAAAINAMTFTPSGLLIAVNSNAGVPQATQLVSINVATGAVAAMGALPEDTDALTFTHGATPGVMGTLGTLSGRVIALIALGAGSLLGLVAFAWWQRRSRPPRA